MGNEEKEKNTPNILVSADFSIQGVSFVGAFEKGANESWLVGSARNIKLKDLFHNDSIPDLELDDISCGYALNSKNYFFRTILGVSINLSHLPLVGKVFPTDQTVSIDNLAVMVKGERGKDSKDTGTGKDAKPTVSIGADINIGGKAEKLELKLHAPINKPKILLALNDSEPGSETDKTQWFDINKTFGPVSFKRVGMLYEKEGARLFFMMDASMAIGPLAMSLAGLGVGSSIKSFKPEFMLEGLGLSYSQGGIMISGALLYDKMDNSFTGCAVIKTPPISLAALGGYQTIDGQASVFIYAVMSGKAGLITVNIGPVFLQITGIAAGFGFNRGLIIPDVDQVKEFPLVRVATADADFGKDPLAVLRKVKTYIPAAKGEMFFALGVKFNIQKLIDCFALMIVRVGHNLRLDIVGLAKVGLPTDTSVPLAQVEMAYKVAFNINEGSVQIAAALTPASFIFTKDCRLTGGFAFYAWFYGLHGGDFVLSIGGYHPGFQVPAHYPLVPRVGFQWQLIPELSLKGELYCALTPSAMMAGGLLQAVFQFERTISFDIGIAGASLTGMIKACFLMVVDFLMAWQPFSYQARLSIAIGIEATFRGTAHFLGFKKTVERCFDLHLSANLQIWGPEFSGIAHVDWKIVSFDIKFGKQGRIEPKALTWEQFKRAFLPADENVCTVSVTEGMIREVDRDNEKVYVVNPSELVLTINSVIPAIEVKDGKDNNLIEDKNNGKSFGIGSMNISQVANSVLTININKDNATNQFQFEPIWKNVPAAMWGDKPRPELNSSSLLDGMLMGVRITAPKPHTPDKEQTVNSDYESNDKKDVCCWQSAMTFNLDGKGEFNINDDKVQKTRNEIFKALNLKKPVSLGNTSAEMFLKMPEVGTLAA